MLTCFTLISFNYFSEVMAANQELLREVHLHHEALEASEKQLKELQDLILRLEESHALKEAIKPISWEDVLVGIACVGFIAVAFKHWPMNPDPYQYLGLLSY